MSQPSHDAARHSTKSAEETLALFQLGMRVDRIMEERGLARSTVLGHLVPAIEQGEANELEVVGMSQDAASAIESVWRALAEPDRMRLQPLFEALDGKISYEVLRCLRAGWMRVERT